MYLSARVLTDKPYVFNLGYFYSPISGLGYLDEHIHLLETIHPMAINTTSEILFINGYQLIIKHFVNIQISHINPVRKMLKFKRIYSQTRLARLIQIHNIQQKYFNLEAIYENGQ